MFQSKSLTTKNTNIKKQSEVVNIMSDEIQEKTTTSLINLNDSLIHSKEECFTNPTENNLTLLPAQDRQIIPTRAKDISIMSKQDKKGNQSENKLSDIDFQIKQNMNQKSNVEDGKLFHLMERLSNLEKKEKENSKIIENLQKQVDSLPTKRVNEVMGQLFTSSCALIMKLDQTISEKLNCSCENQNKSISNSKKENYRKDLYKKSGPISCFFCRMVGHLPKNCPNKIVIADVEMSDEAKFSD